MDKPWLPNDGDLLEATIMAEEGLIGAILLFSSGGTKQAITESKRVVKPSDFHGYYSPHPMFRQPPLARIFHAMTECEIPPHEINVALQMQQLNILQKGDCVYMVHLVAMCPCPLDYIHYARAVAWYSAKRQGIKPRTSAYGGIVLD